MSENKKEVGRPSKYKEEFNQKVIDLMREGCSIAEVCFELEICKQTFYNWCDENEEFLDSKKKGVDYSEGWWMKQGRKSLKDQSFNYTGWYMNMKNRFNWADKKEIKEEKKIISEIDYSELDAGTIKNIIEQLRPNKTKG